MQGRTFGDFAIKERLGEGGGGEVYLAEQLTLGRQAVVKVMARGTDQGDTEQGGVAAERFLREARLASQLDHPFAAHVYGFGTESDGVLWIAMELVRGTALNVIIQEQGPIPLSRFVPFFERLCEVVHAAHEQGIVHRDIKPANVMVISRAGRLLPKLLDLGIARRGPDITAPLDTAPDPEFASSRAFDTRDGSPATLSETLSDRLAESETLNLTRAGAIIGTPSYMAPEQWSDASVVDARADLYSLSLLAFQAITGKVAFSGTSLRQLVKAHANQPLPQLPDSLPPALYDVLSKGAAKRAGDRYSTAIELGAALRAASDIGAEPFALPQLDEGLRENLLSEAPQPIAEAVALLEGSRTPKQQLESVTVVRKVLIRHLATLALAARGRVGPGSAEDGSVTKHLLMQLRQDRLSDEQWLSLARELCRPFSFRKAAHPVPELVTFFFSNDSDVEPGAGTRALAALDALGLPVPTSPEPVVHAALLKLVPALGSLLQSLAFVFDYALVVRQEHPERWMGTRRTRRTVQPLAADADAALGQPLLIDAVGGSVLNLSPLMQLMTPGAGMSEELFFLDGAGRHGARLAALPGPFERQSGEVWPWFAANIFDAMQLESAAQQNEKPPYKGLSTFTADDADNYFGREREAEAFANRLKLSPLLAVVGPSGSGKSSFILAGVVPLLPPGWSVAVTRPGANPFQALTAKLGVGALVAEQILGTLAEDGSMLIVVDQFEELITLCQEVETRQRFAAMLVALAEHPSRRIRVVLTLRDDFLIKIQQLTSLQERLSSTLQLLGTPAQADLLRVVTEPAARVGYGFDDASLPQKMVDEVADYPGALALLSFTASQLWELRDRHLHQMRAKTYDALGGVGGALAHHAEMTLSQMSPEQLVLVREAFRQLVTSQATRAVLTRKEMIEVLGASPAAHSVLEKLVVARLLVTSEDLAGDDRVEIIHEALIVAWPRLVSWLREDAENARLRDSLRASAKQWLERGRPSGLLWRKETLAEYRAWRARFPGRLTQGETEFATASLRDESRAKNIRRGLTLLAFTALAVGLVVLFRAYRLADASALEAKGRLADLRVEQARLSAIDDKPFQTVLFAAEARRLGADGETLRYLEGRAQTKLTGQVAARDMHEGLSLVASPTAGRIAAIGVSGSFQMVNSATLETVGDVVETGAGSLSFGFFPQGHSGVLCGDDRSVRVVHDDGPSTPLSVPLKAPPVQCVVDHAGRRVAILESGGLLHLVQVDERGTLEADRLLALGVDAEALAFSPDGLALVTFDGSKVSARAHVETVIVDVVKAVVRARLDTGKERLLSAAFSLDSTLVAFGSRDTNVHVFAVADGKRRFTLRGHSDWVNEVIFSQTGKQIASASNDRSLRLWDVATGNLVVAFNHSAPVLRSFSLDDEHWFTATGDGLMHHWARGDTAPLVSLYGHVSGVTGLAKLDNHRFVSSSGDGMLRLWDFDRLESVSQIETRAGHSFTRPSSNGAWVMTGPNDGFERWDLRTAKRIDAMRVDGCEARGGLAFTGSEPPLVASSEGAVVCVMTWGPHAIARRFEGHAQPVRWLEFSGDGALLVSSSNDSEVIVWDVATGTVKQRLKHASATRGIGFSSDERLLVVGTQDGMIHIWDWRANHEQLQWKGHGDAVQSTEFIDNDHSILSMGMDQQISEWDATTGALTKRYFGHSTSGGRAHLSPDTKFIASADWSGTIYVWDRKQGLAIDRISAGSTLNDVRWLPDGRLIAGLVEESSLQIYRLGGVPADTGCLNPLVFAGNVVTRAVAWPARCAQASRSP